MKGILFKPDMIKAIVKGRKTVTRRRIDIDPLGWELSGFNEGGLLDFGVVHFWRKDYTSQGLTVKPKYKVGEVVYIKEVWHFLNVNYESPMSAEHFGKGNDFAIEYTDGELRWWKDNGGEYNYPINEKQRSPLFMPEKFARYFIKIAEVSAEQLQEITPNDCIAEGIFKNYTDTMGEHSKSINMLIDEYLNLWDSINKDYPFESNPYVFRYEFGLTSVGAMK